jgi:hypothetical protein
MNTPMRRPSCVPADRPWPPRRIEHVADASPAAHDAFLQVTGRVKAHAELRHGAAGGTAVLTFDVDVGRGWPYAVRLIVADDPSALFAAERKASRLVAGALVHVYARGCLPRTTHDTAALQLLDVTDVITQEE